MPSAHAEADQLVAVQNAFAAALHFKALLQSSPELLFSAYQLLGSRHKIDAPGEQPVKLQDLFLSSLSHGQLLDQLHALRGAENRLVSCPPSDVSSSWAMASMLEAFDSGVCKGAHIQMRIVTNATAARCARTRCALVIEWIAIRKEQSDWRQHEAELAWLRVASGWCGL